MCDSSIVPILIAAIFVVLMVGLIGGALGVFTRRDPRITRGMDDVADDLRRADDGRPEDPFSDFGNPMGPTGNRL
jgi:hypothetical protein